MTPWMPKAVLQCVRNPPHFRRQVLRSSGKRLLVARRLYMSFEVKHDRQQLARDLRWGLRRGVFFSALFLLPETFAFLRRVPSNWKDAISFGKTVVLYLSYGVAVGLAAGFWRERVVTRTGATAFGAFIGTLTVVGMLLVLGANGGRFNARVDPLAVLMGAISGAFVGWYFWVAFRRHSRTGE